MFAEQYFDYSICYKNDVISKSLQLVIEILYVEKKNAGKFRN